MGGQHSAPYGTCRLEMLCHAGGCHPSPPSPVGSEDSLQGAPWHGAGVFCVPRVWQHAAAGWAAIEPTQQALVLLSAIEMKEITNILLKLN